MRRGDRDVHIQVVPLGDADEEIDVSGDQVAFSRDRKREVTVTGKHLQQRAGQAKATLGRLVWIGGGADGGVPATQIAPPQIADQRLASALLHEYLPLEVEPVFELHELVGITRETVS